MSDEQPMYTDGEGNLFRSKHNAIAHGDLRKRVEQLEAIARELFDQGDFYVGNPRITAKAPYEIECLVCGGGGDTEQDVSHTPDCLVVRARALLNLS